MKQLTTSILAFTFSLAVSGLAWAQAEPGADAAPANSASQPAAGPAAGTCFPPCRAGYVCANAQCVPACNPPCPSGTLCTPDLTCEPIAAAPAPASEAGPAEPLTRAERREQQRADREREREARRQEREIQRAETDKMRLEHRKRLRVQMGMGVGIGEGYDDDAAVFHFGFQPGVRWNFHDHFGFSVLGNFLIGSFTDTLVDNGSMLGARLHFNPYFGPLGRFIVGPSLMLGRTWYTYEETAPVVGPTGGLQEGTVERNRALWMGGVGFRGGLLLGATESVEISFGVYRLSEGTSPRFSLFESTEVDFAAGFGF